MFTNNENNNINILNNYNVGKFLEHNISLFIAYITEQYDCNFLYYLLH